MTFNHLNLYMTDLYRPVNGVAFVVGLNEPSRRPPDRLTGPVLSALLEGARTQDGIKSVTEV